MRRIPSWRSTPAHTQPEPHWRTGLGVEPMTCAPNAFRSGDGLIRLALGESSTASWDFAQPDRQSRTAGEANDDVQVLDVSQILARSLAAPTDSESCAAHRR